jgi:hypothetical protein
MSAFIIDNQDVSYMDKLLFDDTGLLRPVASADLQALPPLHLMLWGNKNGVYTYPTIELIEFFRENIADRTAIEICSGTGVFGRALGIPSTDSYIQTSPEMMTTYLLMGQHPIQPPADVLKFEANEAVDHFKPEVVIACYATQKYLPGDEGPPVIGSSVYGVDEIAMLPKIQTYIHVGNAISHQDKRIRKLPHIRYQKPWVITRSGKPEFNEIVIWNK